MFGMAVGEDETTVDIRKAYRMALRQFHPDKLTGKPVRIRVYGTEVFKLINQKMEEYSRDD